jgi:surface antigen
MRSDVSLAPLAAFVATAFCLVAWIVIAPDGAFAGSEKASSQRGSQSGAPATPPAAAPQAPANRSQGCQCPDAETKPDKPWKKQQFADLPPSINSFDEGDEISVLQAVHLALTEVGDGASYVWQRQNGRLSGLVHPTSSFKDKSGRICRHIVVMLNTIVTSKRVESVACRLDDGSWQLDG